MTHEIRFIVPAALAFSDKIATFVGYVNNNYPLNDAFLKKMISEFKECRDRGSKELLLDVIRNQGEILQKAIEQVIQRKTKKEMAQQFLADINAYIAENKIQLASTNHADDTQKHRQAGVAAKKKIVDCMELSNSDPEYTPAFKRGKKKDPIGVPTPDNSFSPPPIAPDAQMQPPPRKIIPPKKRKDFRLLVTPTPQVSVSSFSFLFTPPPKSVTSTLTTASQSATSVTRFAPPPVDECVLPSSSNEMLQLDKEREEFYAGIRK